MTTQPSFHSNLILVKKSRHKWRMTPIYMVEDTDVPSNRPWALSSPLPAPQNRFRDVFLHLSLAAHHIEYHDVLSL